MLEELRIEAFAVIDQLELRFGAGFNVITGETGAGKSILIDAVELLLGSRASPAFVRAGSERCRIEGSIRLDARARAAVLPLLQRENLLDEAAPDTLSIMREIRRRGRSSSRVNGISVRSELLSQLGAALVDIHGQSQHLSLLRPRHHIDLLDRYADLLELRAGLGGLLRELLQVQANIRQQHEDAQALQRRAELLRHELEELHAAQIVAGEERALEQERKRLANSERLAQLAAEARRLLADDESARQRSAIDGLMGAAAALARIEQIDPTLADDYQLAEELSQQAQELSLRLARYAETVEYDPYRLDELEERLELLNGLKRRFRVESSAELLDYAEGAAAELAQLDASDAQLRLLSASEQDLLRRIGDISAKLSRERADACQRLSRAVVHELSDLRMERARFEVLLQQVEHPAGCIVGERRFKFDAKGIDDVEFLLSANPGEPPRPLAAVASGGEAARIMLALKRVLAKADHTPILIFDEVDQGIGGRLGAVLGEKLWGLTAGHQVLCVTHLPQLASYADCHFQVRKTMGAAHTATAVVELRAEEARVTELAEMLGAAGAAGLQSARELLAAARAVKGR